MPPKQAAKAAAPAPAAVPAGKGKAAAAEAKAKSAAINGRPASDDRDREPRAASNFVHISGKPDKEAHEKEMKAFDDEITKLRTKQEEIRKRLGGKDDKSSPANARRQELRDQLSSLRTEQASAKSSRGKILDQIKALNDGIATKGTNLKATREKSKFRSVADVDAEIKRLEKSVESGQLRLVDEKKTLAEISNLRRSRKTVESFGGLDEAIQADKKRVDDLRKQLDAPEAKAASDKYNALREELDKINADNDEARSSKNKVFEERDAVKAQLDAVHEKKRDARNAFRDASDKYYQKVQEEKRRRQEKERAERLAYTERKRTEENERLREDAKQPAYDREIEDCRNLVAFFTKGASVAPAQLDSATIVNASATGNLPQLNLRKVEDDGAPPLGVALKKKGEDQEDFFVGKGGKGRKGRGAASSATAAKQSFNLPLQYLSALISLGVNTPTSQADIPQLVEALQAKRKWFEENQDAETKKRIADVEKRITANEAKSREAHDTSADAPAAKTTTMEKPAPVARRASAEAEVPAPAVEAPKLAGAEVTTDNADAEPVTADELASTNETTVEGSTEAETTSG